MPVLLALKPSLSAVVGGSGGGAVPKPLVRSPHGLCTRLILQGSWHLPSACRGVAVGGAHKLPRISLHRCLYSKRLGQPCTCSEQRVFGLGHRPGAGRLTRWGGRCLATAQTRRPTSASASCGKQCRTLSWPSSPPCWHTPWTSLCRCGTPAQAVSIWWVAHPACAGVIPDLRLSARGERLISRSCWPHPDPGRCTTITLALVPLAASCCDPN